VVLTVSAKVVEEGTNSSSASIPTQPGAGAGSDSGAAGLGVPPLDETLTLSEMLGAPAQEPAGGDGEQAGSGEESSNQAGAGDAGGGGEQG
jgi:hypothetical protein